VKSFNEKSVKKIYDANKASGQMLRGREFETEIEN